MSSNQLKNRLSEIDSLQKLSDGLTKYTTTLPTLFIAGTTLKTADVVTKLQTRITQNKAVESSRAAWLNDVQTDQSARAAIHPFLNDLRQTLLAAFSGQVNALNDFGLTPRKKAVVSPATRTAAAIKAKATRAARGPVGKKQKAAIAPLTAVAPAAGTAMKMVPIEAPGTTSTAPGSAPPTHA